MGNSNKFHIERDFTKKELTTIVVCVLVIGFLCAFAIIAFTPIRTLIPGYPNATIRYQQVQNELRIDSLKKSIYRWELYTENLRRVVEGGKPVGIDSIIRKSQSEYSERDHMELAKSDSVLREVVQNEEKSVNRDGAGKTGQQIEGMHFFKPLNGTVSMHYEIAQHPYIDITAPSGSAVKSVLDGSVIHTAWSERDDWIIIIQHSNGIISIYKHNETLLKKVADKVSAGTSIAILGDNAANDTKRAHLHFELWQNGEPLDPVTFIKF